MTLNPQKLFELHLDPDFTEFFSWFLDNLNVDGSYDSWKFADPEHEHERIQFSMEEVLQLRNTVNYFNIQIDDGDFTAYVKELIKCTN